VGVTQPAEKRCGGISAAATEQPDVQQQFCLDIDHCINLVGLTADCDGSLVNGDPRRRRRRRVGIGQPVL
jgi:hypothetical protein